MCYVNKLLSRSLVDGNVDEQARGADSVAVLVL